MVYNFRNNVKSYKEMYLKRINIFYRLYNVTKMIICTVAPLSVFTFITFMPTSIIHFQPKY